MENTYFILTHLKSYRQIVLQYHVNYCSVHTYYFFPPLTSPTRLYIYETLSDLSQFTSVLYANAFRSDFLRQKEFKHNIYFLYFLCFTFFSSLISHLPEHQRSQTLALSRGQNISLKKTQQPTKNGCKRRRATN